MRKRVLFLILVIAIVASAILPAIASAAGCGPWTYLGRVETTAEYNYANGQQWATTYQHPQMVVFTQGAGAPIRKDWDIYAPICGGGYTVTAVGVPMTEWP